MYSLLTYDEIMQNWIREYENYEYFVQNAVMYLNEHKKKLSAFWVAV